MDVYIVEQGDTIESIGRKYNIPVIEIIKANNLKAPYILTIGQSLTIPTNLYNIFNYYTVKAGDTLYNIAEKESTTVDVLAGVNGINPNEYIYEGQTLLIPKQDVELYITKTGDTIDTISEHFSAPSAEVIYSNNDIYLLPGQLIIYRRT
jgi:LysM repeat protein